MCRLSLSRGQFRYDRGALAPLDALAARVVEQVHASCRHAAWAVGTQRASFASESTAAALSVVPPPGAGPGGGGAPCDTCTIGKIETFQSSSFQASLRWAWAMSVLSVTRLAFSLPQPDDVPAGPGSTSAAHF